MGLALGGPEHDDERDEREGVAFFVPGEVRHMMAQGADLRIEFNRWWKSFSVRLGEGGDCC